MIYRASDDLLFNVGTTYDYISKKIEDNSDYSVKKYSFIVGNKYISDKQLADILNVQLGELKINIPDIIETIIRMKKCVPPSSNLNEFDNNMTFYTVPNAYTRHPLIIGMTDYDNKNANHLYIKFENNELTFEAILEIDTTKEVSIDEPKNKYSDKEIKLIKKITSFEE